jgi:hypothetical protein
MTRTKRLATVTAGAALAAVAVGITSSPAMAATGALDSSRTHSSSGPLDSSGAAALTTANTGARAPGAAARHGGLLGLDAAMIAPLGGAPSGLSAAPIAKPAPDGPLSHLARHSAAAPHQLPAHTRSVVSVAAPTHSQPPAPATPPPAPKPYLMYDSVTPQMIPAGVKVATYATGGYAVPASVVAGRNVMWIDTQGTDPAAQALDVEPGDATPSVAASWAFQKLSKTPGDVARIYTMISEWPAVKAAIATLPQRMQSHIRYWIADPTGYNHVVPGSDATQWYWGKNFDISTANPNF